MRSGSTARSPVKLLISIGKKASSDDIAIFEPSPKPNQITTSGAIATFGSDCSAKA